MNLSTNGSWAAEPSAAIACLGCRRLKMRCIMTAQQPCARCLKAGRECVVQPSRRGVQKSESSQKQPTRRKTRERSIGLWRSDDQKSETAPGCSSRASTRSPVTSNSPSKLGTPGDLSSTSARTPASSDTAASTSHVRQSPTGHLFHVSPSHPALTDEALYNLTAFFREKLLYFVPILDLTDLSDVTKVVHLQRPLALAASLVAANFAPGAASLQKYLKPAVSDFLASLDGPISADPEVIWTQLQACAVLYAHRASTDIHLTDSNLHPQDEQRLNHWRMKAAIELFAMRLSLHRSLDDVRVMISRGDRDVSESHSFRKATVWLWLFTMSHHFSLATETPPTIRFDNSIRNACVLLSQIEVPSRICRMLAEVDLALLWDRAGAQLPGLGEWWCAAPYNFDCEEATSVLADAGEALMLWTKRWGIDGVVDPTFPGLDVSQNGVVEYHFRATRFWLHTFTARLVYQQAMRNPTQCSQLQPLYLDLVIQSVRAAETMAQWLLDLPPLKLEIAKYTADFGFVLIALCCLYTKRICGMLGDRSFALGDSLNTVDRCGKLLGDMSVGSNQMPLILGRRVRECYGSSQLPIMSDIMSIDTGLILSQCRADLHWIDHLT